jgi:hypothetical protein
MPVSGKGALILGLIMKMFSHHPKRGYHTWRDIGGPVGLVLDLVFCGFVVVAAFFMIAFCTGLLLLDYLLSPVWAVLSRFRTLHAV